MNRCNPTAIHQEAATAPKSDGRNLDLLAAVQQTEMLSELGQHAEALEASDSCMLALGAAAHWDQCRLAVQLHCLRASSHHQLGDLKLAVAECSAAIQLVEKADVGDARTRCKLLIARSAFYEQEERWSAALADACAAVHGQQPPSQQAVLAVSRLRKVCRQAGVPYAS